MTDKEKSILLVSPEPAVTQAIGTALQGDENLTVHTKNSTLAQLNGSAVKMAVDFDVILFHTSPDNSDDLSAIRALAQSSTGATKLVALADGNISLAQARALNNAGVDEVLPVSSMADEISGQIAKMAPPVASAAEGSHRHGKIIAVAQARGGIGSTTVSVNLADQLAGPKKLKRNQPRCKVALVDLDLQFGTVGSFLDLEQQDILLQLALDGTIPDETFLTQSMPVMANDMSVLPAPNKFAPLDSLRVDQVAAILETLQRTNDYVIVDMPRALVNWVEAVIQRADEVILVTDVSVSSIAHCRRLIDFFTTDNVALPIKILINGEKKPMFQSALHKEAAKALDRKLDYWLPDDPKAASTAADRGQPLAQSAARSPLTKAFAKLAKETETEFSARNAETGGK